MGTLAATSFVQLAGTVLKARTGERTRRLPEFQPGGQPDLVQRSHRGGSPSSLLAGHTCLRQLRRPVSWRLVGQRRL